MAEILAQDIMLFVALFKKRFLFSSKTELAATKKRKPLKKPGFGLKFRRHFCRKSEVRTNDFSLLLVSIYSPSIRADLAIAFLPKLALKSPKLATQPKSEKPRWRLAEFPALFAVPLVVTSNTNILSRK